MDGGWSGIESGPVRERVRSTSEKGFFALNFESDFAWREPHLFAGMGAIFFEGNCGDDAEVLKWDF